MALTEVVNIGSGLSSSWQTEKSKWLFLLHRVVIVATIIVLPPGSSGQDSSTRDKTDSELVSPSPGSNEVFVVQGFTPHAGLQSVRFGYVEQGRVACELSDDYKAIYDVLEKNPEYSDNNHDPYVADLSADDRDYAVKHVMENIGDIYTLFFPQTYTFSQARLSDLTLLFTGLGTYGGIMGILDVADPSGLPENESTVLVFPTDFAERARASKPERPAETSSVYQGAKQFLSDVLSEEPEILRVEFLSTRDGLVFLAVLLRRLLDDNTYLYCVCLEDGAWKTISPDPCAESCDNTNCMFISKDKIGVIVDSGRSDTHVAMSSGELYILPDIDGDGFNEVFSHANAYDILSEISSNTSRTGGSILILIEKRCRSFV